MNKEINGTTEQSHDFVEDAEELLEATANATEEAVVQARQRLAASLEEAEGTCSRVQEKVRSGAAAADKMIRENPYPAIGIAFGIGALAGVLLNRRNRG